MAKNETVFTPTFRASYCYLVKPRTEDYQKKKLDKPSYEVEAIFDDPATMKPDQKKLYDGMITMARNEKVATWGDMTPPDYQSPIKKGNDKIDKAVAKARAAKSEKTEAEIRESMKHYKDKIVINFKSKEFPVGLCKINPGSAPTLWDHPVTGAAEAERELYAGCYMQAEVSCFHYDYGKPGISFGLHHVMKVREGEPLAGGKRGNAAASFGAISQAADPSEYGVDNGHMFANEGDLDV